MKDLALSVLRDGFAQPGLVDRVFAMSTDELCEFWAWVTNIVGDLGQSNVGPAPIAALFTMVAKNMEERAGAPAEPSDLTAHRVFADLMRRVSQPHDSGSDSP